MPAAGPLGRSIMTLVRISSLAAGVFTAVGGVLGWEIFWARAKTGVGKTVEAPQADGLYGGGYPGEPLHLALIGDSLAAGLGAGSPEETIGALLASGLADTARRPVLLRNVAVVGAQSRDLRGQLDLLLGEEAKPDVAMIVIGANDVTHLTRPSDAVSMLFGAVRRLRSAGAQVVVATCPDLGSIRPMFQPLRSIMYWAGRLLASTQTIVVLRAGGRTVSLADSMGPPFRTEPGVMFSADNFHPSSVGYARTAEVLLPSICAAAGCWTRKDMLVPHRVYSRDRPDRLALLAFRATRRAGIETSARSEDAAAPVTVGHRRLPRIPRPGRRAASRPIGRGRARPAT